MPPRQTRNKNPSSMLRDVVLSSVALLTMMTPAPPDDQMKIAVCIKHVLARDSQPRLDDDKTWIRESDAAYEMNEPDAYALEEALRLKEKRGGEVVVCSAGPARVAQVIREALARGADRAIHVEDDALGRADASVVASALAGAMADEQFDLILTGLQSDDQGFAQTGVILAERLGLSHATIIMEVDVDASAGAGPAATRSRQARARRRVVPVGRDAVAGAADDSKRDQPAALRDAQGHHGGQEEGDPQGLAAVARGCRGHAENRRSLRARERRRRPRSSAARPPRRPKSWCAGCARTRGSFERDLYVFFVSSCLRG